MSGSAAKAALAEIAKRFPSLFPQAHKGGTVIAEFSPKHPEFGSVIVQDDGDEVTLFVGKFTHVHFACDEDDVGAAAAARNVAEAGTGKCSPCEA